MNNTIDTTLTSHQSSTYPNLRALLIGVDCYMPNLLPGGNYYPNLKGCVRDVKHVETFLRNRLKVPSERITVLTASNQPNSTEPAEPCEQWPTYQNIVTAFKKLTQEAQPGEQIFILNSSHGARAKTIFPKLKSNGLDEALVPTDIGNTEARYLRDVELAHLLKAMTDKGLIVTIVLDCCHSGGATRGRNIGKVMVRGVSEIDTAQRPTDSLVASIEELAATWESQGRNRSTRNLKEGGSEWLLQPEGYTFLAACRAHESAYEYPFDGNESNGALTYWLLDSLKDIGPGLTYKMLYDRILAKIHTQFEDQTPQLEGDAQRTVFGCEQVIQPFTATVQEIVPDKKQLRLNIGMAQGIGEGACFAIYPPLCIDFGNLKERQAIAAVETLGGDNSWATISELLNDQAVIQIEQGAKAVLLNVGEIPMVHKVGLAKSLVEEPRLKTVMDLLKNDLDLTAGFVEAADENMGEVVDYQIDINHLDEYEIWDSAGVLLPNLHPALKINEPDSARRLVERLVQLAKYHSLLKLENYDDLSPLTHKLKVALLGHQAKFLRGQPIKPLSFKETPPALQTGEWTFVQITNKSSKPLNVAVLDFQPDWGVSQVYPSQSNFETIDPGDKRIIPLKASLPGDYQSGIDVIKVFGTVGPTNFRWLEMPALDQPGSRSRSKAREYSPSSPLEKMLDAIASGKTRNVSSMPSPSEEWVTAQKEIRINKTDILG